jgi:hypothetical protein
MPDKDHWYSYEPVKGHGLPHDPMISIVGPRPIGWISTVGRNGSNNLAPYSFFNLFNYTPPIVGFASITYDIFTSVKDLDRKLVRYTRLHGAHPKPIKCKYAVHRCNDIELRRLVRSARRSTMVHKSRSNC